jgi:hypothetical protein
MIDFMNVSYLVENSASSISRVGGLAGYNTGLIKKIDSNRKSFSGYTNYMAYALIKSTPKNLSEISTSNLPSVELSARIIRLRITKSNVTIYRINPATYFPDCL